MIKYLNPTFIDISSTFEQDPKPNVYKAQSLALIYLALDRDGSSSSRNRCHKSSARTRFPDSRAYLDHPY